VPKRKAPNLRSMSDAYLENAAKLRAGRGARGLISVTNDHPTPFHPMCQRTLGMAQGCGMKVCARLIDQPSVRFLWLTCFLLQRKVGGRGTKFERGEGGGISVTNDPTSCVSEPWASHEGVRGRDCPRSLIPTPPLAGGQVNRWQDGARLPPELLNTGGNSSAR